MKAIILLLILLAFTAQAVKNTNWIQCAKDGVQLAQDVQKLSADAAAKNIQAVIADLQAITNDINALKKDCGITFIHEVKLGSWEDCTKDVLQISELSLDITSDIAHFNIEKLSQDVDALYEVVQKALKDCEKSTNLGTNWIQCAKDGVQIAEDVQKLTQDAAAKNIEAVIADLQAILNDINLLKKDCGISTVSEVMVGDWAQCLQDVQTISTLANAITDDIKHFNIIKLAEDVEKLSQAVNQALKDCTGELQGTNWIQCAKDGVQLAEDVQKLTADAAAKKIEAVIADLQAITNDINNLKKDCGISTIPQVNLGGWEECTSDVLEISQMSLDITEDIAHFNIVKLSQDVDALYEEVQKAIKDCEKSSMLGTNWIQCAKDAVQLASDVQQLTTDAAAKNIQAVINDLQAILNDINTLKKDCGISTVSEVMVGDWAKCLQDVQTISTLANAITDDIKHFNIIKLAEDVEKLSQAVNQALTDCTGELQGTNWIQCAKDGVQLAQDVQQLSADAAAQKIQAVIADLQAITNDIAALKKDCGISTVSETMVGDWAQCLQDIQQISTLTSDIQDDIKHMNLVKLAIDVNALSAEVTKAQTDCQQGLDATNWIQCAKDGVQLAEDVQKLTADAAAKKIEAVIADLQAILNDINALKKDCGISFTEREIIGDWAQCMKDVETISQLAQAITDDIAHFNLIKLTEDVDKLYNEVQQALKDCTGQINSYNMNFIQCTKQVTVLIQKLENLLKDFKNKQKTAVIIADLSAISAELQLVGKDCVLSIKVAVQSIGDWDQCLKDIEAIEKITLAIKDDIAHYNIIQLTKDVEDLTKEVETAQQDCK